MPTKYKSYKSKTRQKHNFFSGRVKLLIAVGLIILVSVAALQVIGMTSPKPNNQTSVLLTTSMGTITIELYDDMPITSENFKNLTQHGIYDGTIFHRVVKDFVIQGGDASTKGINVPTIRDELPNKHSNVRGSVVMAKTSEPNSATSQFYVNLKDNLNLDSNYSVFGRVIAGMDVADAIGNVAVDGKARPLEDVTIKNAAILP